MKLLGMCLGAGLAMVGAGGAWGQTAENPAGAGRLETVLREGFTYRNLGPFRAGSWVSDIAVPERPAQAHRYTFYVAARNGGLWKTTNNGTTFAPVFDGAGALSMGAVAVAPSDENVVWVGTGEASCTRSATAGDGVYRSTDGGRSWQKMGLRDSHHVARIVIHPADPDIVYVAAMGHLFSENPERGVFKTTDGGKTWKKVLYVDERTGAVDLVLNRRDPETLYAAMYDCQRRPWTIMDGGPGSGIYKTSDGGGKWRKLGGGLPEGTLGRIGLDLYQANPEILYAVVDNRNPAPPATEPASEPALEPTTRPRTEEEWLMEEWRQRRRGPKLMGGEAYRSGDGGRTWRKMNSRQDDLSKKSGYAFNQLRIDPKNPERIFVTGASMALSEDGGRTWVGVDDEDPAPPPFRRAFGDFRTLWIDAENPARMLTGSDGGMFVTYDGGKTCDHFVNLPLGEIYALTADMETPYNLYAGLQDHDSWKGASNGWSGRVGIEDWTTVGIGDGMYNQVDPTDSRWVFNTQEFGRHARFDQETRTRVSIAPRPGEGEPRLRFNWTAPLRLSPHDPKTLYAGAQHLYRSRDRGDHWERISPDLTTNDAAKIPRPWEAIQYCTITTISESPVKGGVIWVGTDDGKVQVTQDGGAAWTDLTGKLTAAGAPEDAWVTRVVASGFREGTAYAAKSRSRQDDARPMLFKTTDFGASWKAIAQGLPEGAVNAVCEDSVNPNVLFAGSDAGVFVSVDGGGKWMALRGNMPRAPVTDLMVHPREGDLIAGTFGRGIWVTNIAAVREMSAAMANEEVHFFTVRPRGVRRQGALGSYRLYGDRPPATDNEPNGTVLEYYLKEAAEEVTITVAGGGKSWTLKGPGKAGMNRTLWIAPEEEIDEYLARWRRPKPAVLPAGEYTLTLRAGDRSAAQKVRVGEMAVPTTMPDEEDEGVERD